ncbi:putative secreted protein (Por secretion system target) [Lacibacter cauensis]|uniref:Putative secreted protein (Por secretion system target) n=1 Tax=Lacibacter cauensis TaxID=510947 RepID=A0A562SUW5_9BACT|nr:LamG-like jellyroll fold domain-containing protein [Lacibacter cauensis]TWI85085.1 putative secreted protein (Por secretion system target) [Lacibacter cauensis]
MKKSTLLTAAPIWLLLCALFSNQFLNAQTLAFPEAEGFGRYAQGARANATRQVYIVTNLNDSGAGSFRDAVSQPGRIVVFAVGGIITLQSDVVVSANCTIAGQTAPGDGITIFNKRVTFTGASNTICRYLRFRLGATGNSGKDASGLANGNNMIMDHMSFSWGMDEVFSINWDGKGTAPDNISIQNSIIAQGLHRENHSAGGLIQTPDGGKVSLIKNLYISNKTRNPKVKGVNEFVNNVIYNWGNGNRLGDNLNYGWSGEAYIMGGSSGVSEVNIINNYFMSGPLTPPGEASPFSRGTGTFYLYGAGNYFDNNRNGLLDGDEVPYNSSATGYPGIADEGFKTAPFPYPAANPSLSAAQAYEYVMNNAGSNYPRRDQVDALLISEVASKGVNGFYVYRETDLPFTNGGVGNVFNAPAATDSDSDGMPDVWEDANGLNKNNAADATAFSTSMPQYLNIEVYINSLVNTPAADFVKHPTAVTLTASSFELPSPNSKIVVKWKDNADNETDFIIERSENGTTFTPVAQPVANTVSYDDVTGLLPNKTYYYRLKAVSATAQSAYSPVVSVTTPPIASAPTVTSNPNPTNNAQQAEPVNGSVKLTWSGSSNTVSYAVFFGTSENNLTQLGSVTYSASPSFTVNNLTEYTTYYWRVDAINTKGTTTGTVWNFRTTKTFPAGLIGYWSFDETEGIDIIDSSEYANHGILGLDDDDLSIRVPGKVNGAVDFATASVDKYVVSIPHKDHLYLNKTPFSISFWMKAPASMLPPDNNTSSYLLCKGSITKNTTTGATGKRFDIEFKNKEFRFAIDDDITKYELSTSGVPFFVNDWVHVVIVRDTAAKKLRVYNNGQMIKEQATGTGAAQAIGEESDFILGNIGELEFLTTTNKPAPYKGMLDEFKVFNYVLNDVDVLRLFHTSPLPITPYAPTLATGTILEGYDETVSASWKGEINTTSYKVYFGTDANHLSFLADATVTNPSVTFTNLQKGTMYFWRVDAIGAAGTTTGTVWNFKAVSPKGMVAHYKFDETTGTVVTDNSNYQWHGAVNNMPGAEWIAGRFANGLNFLNPAATSAVTVQHADHLLFDRNSFTVSMWVNLSSSNSNYNSAVNKDCYLFHKGKFTDPGGKWYGLQLRDSTLTFSIDDASTKVSLNVNLKKASPYFPFNNSWTNIITVKDTAARRLKVYINGVEAGSIAYSATYGNTGLNLPLLIGNSLENKPFHDKLDDIRLYNYALTAQEIQRIQQGAPLVNKVTDPSPANGEPQVSYGSVQLKWKGAAQTYNVYTGNNANNLSAAATAVADQTYTLPNISTLGNLYWRIDAVRDGEVATGDVWSFSVVDTTKPTALARNIAVPLVNGTVTVTAEQVNYGSSDDYGIRSVSIDSTTFDCSQIGEHTITLTVTDNNNNVNTTTAIVTVVGSVPAPAITISRSNTTLTNTDANTVVLGYGAQQLTLTAADANSTQNSFVWTPADNLSSASTAVTTFAPVSAGHYSYTVEAANEYGCKASAQIALKVIDARCGNNMDKLLICKDNKSICIAASAVPAMLNKGYMLAACSAGANARSSGNEMEQNENILLTVSPNPATQQTVIRFNITDAQNYSLDVYNLMGMKIATLDRGTNSGNHLVRYNLSNLSAGLYFLKLSVNGKITTQKLVVQK